VTTRERHVLAVERDVRRVSAENDGFFRQHIAPDEFSGLVVMAERKLSSVGVEQQKLPSEPDKIAGANLDRPAFLSFQEHARRTSIVTQEISIEAVDQRSMPLREHFIVREDDITKLSA